MNDISSLQKQNQQLRDRLSIVEAELQNKTRRMNKIQNDANSTHRQYEELLSRIIELQQSEEEFIAIKQKFQTLYAEDQQKDKLLNEKDQEIKELKKQIESSSIKFDAQDKLIEAKNQEINDLSSNYELAQTNLSNSKQELNDLQNELQKEKANNQLMLTKIHNYEEVIQLYKSQASSFQAINEQNQSDMLIKDTSIENLKKENEKLQIKNQDLQTLVKNSTYILTNSEQELDSSSFLKILNQKISRPKCSSICTQSEDSNQEDSMMSSSSSFILNQEMFPFIKNPSQKKKFNADIKSQFNKEKERVKEREQKKKAEAARKLGEIKDQFQTDLSLEQIIQMHNKLWQEENQQQTFIGRKNQKCV
ncbi:hypothetical protein M9Y10_040200 [Tritrichomonas musculus]|uniref:Uncharacterized protein n=1 Tax=Tritrichomonas musculus TaxID=1915356 RepID=A0ABR2GQR2_9EUKA